MVIHNGITFVRRRLDGSIDIDFYAARATRLHRAAMVHATRRLAGHVFRLLRASRPRYVQTAR